MDFKTQLKELSFQMMLNETKKKRIENDRYYTLRNNNKSSIHSSLQVYQHALLETDIKGYELSLQFNELLLQNDITYNAFIDGPDATNIGAQNLLYTYGLEYPISWYIKDQNQDGFQYGYETTKKINKKHNIFLKELIDMTIKQKLDQFTYQRLVLAAEYLANHHKLLSSYMNNELIEKKKRKTR